MPEVIGPILLQRQCDGGKGDMEDSAWARIVAMRLEGGPAGFWGCGTWFRWWYGADAKCPGCGIAYQCELEHLERYRLDKPKVVDREEILR